MDKKIIRLTESDLHKIVKESVQNILKEIDYSKMPLGDFNQRNDWFRQQVDTDFPNHGVKDSNDWQSTYNTLAQDKIANDKAAAKQAKIQSKLDAAHEKSRALMEKTRLYIKALSWAIGGTDEGFEGYDEILQDWPIIINAGLGKQKRIKADISNIDKDGYSGIIILGGVEYYIALHGCEIWIDDRCHVNVSLNKITAEAVEGGQEIRSSKFDVERTRRALISAFTKKVRENIAYMNSAQG